MAYFQQAISSSYMIKPQINGLQLAQTSLPSAQLNVMQRDLVRVCVYIYTYSYINVKYKRISVSHLAAVALGRLGLKKKTKI